jgi:hypothetical protein
LFYLACCGGCVTDFEFEGSSTNSAEFLIEVFDGCISLLEIASRSRREPYSERITSGHARSSTDVVKRPFVDAWIAVDQLVS